MDSLKVGKEIYSLLNGNDSLTGVVDLPYYSRKGNYISIYSI